MAAVRKVLIQGAGIGGLTLATALGQRGIEVDVVEGAGPNMVLGVGLGQPANALAALAEIGVREQCVDAGFPFEELVLWSSSGAHLATVAPPNGVYAKPSNNAIARPTLNCILRDAAESAGARIHNGVTIWEMREDDDGVEVELATWTGKRTPPTRDPEAKGTRYDLVVGVDGVRSKVREHLFGSKYAPAFTGSAAWRVTIPRPEYLTQIVMALGPDVKAVLTPVNRDEMYFGLITPEPEKPPRAPQQLFEKFHQRAAVFSGPVGDLRDSITSEHTIVCTALEYLTVRDPWYRSRIAIAGDAAHTSAPHLSQGAAMALEDAVTLAEALGEHDMLSAALGAWYERRRDRALFVADVSLALLKKETGVPLTGYENDQLEKAGPNPQFRLITEAY
ncbi:FAD-dependent monooxygenase [Nocardia aobensis]|uniref:FAD-dependent monooxygenase n=1 Tax=Nocardia aobensis TaxID=257277 RepID=A0ABW6PFC1_9NOCA